MKKNIFAILVTTLALSSVTKVNAGLLSIDLNADSLAGALPLGGSHDVAETQGATGYYNANLSATRDVFLRYEYLGYEAGWTNTFIVDGEQVFWNRIDTVGKKDFYASEVGDKAYSHAGPGDLLNFAFAVLIGGNAGYGVVNGANNQPIGTFNVLGFGMPNFFLGYADADQNSVYITLDDGGGKPWTNTSIDDDNHDDLVIKVTAFIPEPNTLVLMGLSLMGLGFITVSRSKKGLVEYK